MIRSMLRCQRSFRVKPLHVPYLTMSSKKLGVVKTLILNIFGCITYIHVLNYRRTKMNDKDFKYIFISYNTQSKAYKLFDLKTKAHMSRDMEYDIGAQI